MPTLPPAIRQHRDACEAALDAAEQAAALIRTYAQDDSRSVVLKGTHDLVTQADLAAQNLIAEVLAEAFPDAALLGEEGASDPATFTDTTDGARWIVDPIDGTTNFAHGVGAYAVSIGLQRGDEIVAGVIYDVARDEAFVAARGEGAYLDSERIRVSATPDLDQALVSHGMPYRCRAHEAAYYDVLRALLHRAQGQRRFGAAAIDLAYIACGRFDAGFLVGIRPWDVAAGWLLVEEAGGRVTDFTGAPYTLTGPLILASNGQPLHDTFAEVLQPLADARC